MLYLISVLSVICHGVVVYTVHSNDKRQLVKTLFSLGLFVVAYVAAVLGVPIFISTDSLLTFGVASFLSETIIEGLIIQRDRQRAVKLAQELRRKYGNPTKDERSQDAEGSTGDTGRSGKRLEKLLRAYRQGTTRSR